MANRDIPTMLETSVAADGTPFVLDLLRATGLFVAATAALYIALRAERRDRRRRPNLRLMFDPATDDVEAGVDGGKDETHWLRLHVANGWDKRTAEDVDLTGRDQVSP